MSVQQIKDLYHGEKLSAREVGIRMKKSARSIYSLMNKHDIPCRTPAETHKFQFLRKPLSYKPKGKLTQQERDLHNAGLMLYWAEGVKSHDYAVDFTNCDKRMILCFLKMLRKIYRVDEDRLRILLYCYANQNSSKLTKYWARVLKVPVGQFFKPYVRQDYNEKKVNRMPNGLVHIRYYDKKLFAQIMKDIDIISTSLLT